MVGQTDKAETISVLADQLFPVDKAARSSCSKAELITKIWSQVLLNNAKKDELLKLSILPKFLSIVEAHAVESEAAHAAVGCLASLASYQNALEELTATGALTNRVIAACLSILQGRHDRSRLPAAQLLLALSAQPALVPRLEPVLTTLLQLLADAGGPAWAGGRQLTTAAAGVLQALLEPSEHELETVKQARRVMCLSNGVVGCLLGQLAGANDKLLLSVAACLRFMALVPGAADVLAGDPHIASQLLQLLGRGGPGVCAFISGIVWELAAAPMAAQQLLDAGAVPALLAVLQQTAGAANWSSKKNKSKAADGKGGNSAGSRGQSSKVANSNGGKKAGGKSGKDRPGSAVAGAAGAVGPPGSQPAAVLMSDPEAAAAVALCNVTGALHHLSFLDAAKQQLGGSPEGLKLLVSLLDKAADQTYDNLVGCLWAAGLLEQNQEKLAAAGAPRHLVQPIPNRWTCAPDGGPISSNGHTSGTSRTAAITTQLEGNNMAGGMMRMNLGDT